MKPNPPARIEWTTNTNQMGANDAPDMHRSKLFVVPFIRAGQEMGSGRFVLDDAGLHMVGVDDD